MCFLESFRKYPSSVNQVKFNIFTPTYRTKKIKDEETIFENEFFKASLTGYKLSQLHKDILDVILYKGDSNIEEMLKDISKAVRTFTLYQIQKKLYQNKEFKQIIENDKKRKKYTNNSWLKRKIKELTRATINIEVKLENKKKMWIEFHIIEEVKVIEYDDDNPRKQRFFIIFSKRFLDFLKSDILINYENYLDDLIKLKTGQAKALARYMMSFNYKSYSESLDSVMEKIGIRKNELTKQAFYNHKKRILSDLEGLKKLNIEIVETTKGDLLVKYEKLENIYFYYNSKEKRVFPTLPAPNKLLSP